MYNWSSTTHISSPLYCRHTVSAKMRGSPQRIFYIEHTIWMSHTAIRKNTLLEDCDKILFLVLTKPACDRSLVPSTDPLVCMMDDITNFIAWNIIIVLGHGTSTF